MTDYGEAFNGCLDSYRFESGWGCKIRGCGAALDIRAYRGVRLLVLWGSSGVHQSKTTSQVTFLMGVWSVSIPTALFWVNFFHRPGRRTCGRCIEDELCSSTSMPRGWTISPLTRTKEQTNNIRWPWWQQKELTAAGAGWQLLVSTEKLSPSAFEWSNNKLWSVETYKGD